MIIELYGLPGSGKTTLANKLARNSGFQVIKIRSNKELLFYNFLFLVKHPIKFTAMFFYLLVNRGNGWRMFYYKFMNTFLQHNAKYQKALRFKNALIDQGYFQNIISVFEKKITPEAIKRYAKFFLYPDKLIVFNMSPGWRLEKMEKRGYNARDGFSEEYKKNWQEVIEHNNKMLNESIKNLFSDVVIIKNDKDIENLKV